MGILEKDMNWRKVVAWSILIPTGLSLLSLFIYLAIKYWEGLLVVAGCCGIAGIFLGFVELIEWCFNQI